MNALYEDIKTHNHVVGRIEAQYMIHSRKKIYTALEEVDMTWDGRDVSEFRRMWREGMCITDMAVAFNRPTMEVFLLALDQAEKSRIKARPGWIFGKGWRV